MLKHGVRDVLESKAKGFARSLQYLFVQVVHYPLEARTSTKHSTLITVLCSTIWTALWPPERRIALKATRPSTSLDTGVSIGLRPHNFSDTLFPSDVYPKTTSVARRCTILAATHTHWFPCTEACYSFLLLHRGGFLLTMTIESCKVSMCTRTDLLTTCGPFGLCWSWKDKNDWYRS